MPLLILVLSVLFGLACSAVVGIRAFQKDKFGLFVDYLQAFGEFQDRVWRPEKISISDVAVHGEKLRFVENCVYVVTGKEIFGTTVNEVVLSRLYDGFSRVVNRFRFINGLTRYLFTREIEVLKFEERGCLAVIFNSQLNRRILEDRSRTRSARISEIEIKQHESWNGYSNSSLSRQFGGVSGFLGGTDRIVNQLSLLFHFSDLLGHLRELTGHDAALFFHGPILTNHHSGLALNRVQSLEQQTRLEYADHNEQEAKAQ